MAPISPFELDDQTDEDFFDKLVDDDDVGLESSVKVSATLVKGNDVFDSDESDEVKAFGDLSISDGDSGSSDLVNSSVSEVVIGSGDLVSSSISEVNSSSGDPVNSRPTEVDNGKVNFELKEVNGSDDIGGASLSMESRRQQVGELNSSLPSSESISFGNGHVVENGTVDSEEKLGLRRESSGSPSGVVKVVQWSAFSDNAAKGSGGSGSYDDFFTGLGQVAIGNVQSTDSFSAVFGDEAVTNTNTGGSYSLTEQTANEVDTNSVEYYESQYPGWKYDPNTGQWYQLDMTGGTANDQGNVVEAGGNALGTFGPSIEDTWAVADVKSSHVSYSQQTTQSSVGTITELSTTVSDWSHNSLQNGEYQYPAHMVFDPQYPGWYYDTVTQNWCSLDEYHLLSPATAPTHNLKGQIGFLEATTYSGQSLNDNGLQVPSSDGEDMNQSWPTTFGQHVEQGSNDGPFASGMHSEPSASFSLHQSWATSHDPNAHNNNQMNQQRNLDSKGTVPSSYGHTNQEQLNGPNWAGFVRTLAPSENGLNQYNHSTPTHDPNAHNNHQMNRQRIFDSPGTVASYGQTNQEQLNGSNWAGNVRTSAPSENGLNQNSHSTPMQPSGLVQYHSDFYNSQPTALVSQPLFSNGHHAPSAPGVGRSSAGRPPHALVTFGFGGKLVVMKDTSSAGFAMYGTKDAEGHSLSVLNLMDMVGVNNDPSGNEAYISSYFHSLCHQSFPGPLVGGSAGSKELNKWIDERINSCASMGKSDDKGEATKLLLSLLKIACQYYGKLRSFGADAGLKENDIPESAVASLFASVKKNNDQLTQYSARKCLMNLPSEQQIQVTASEVENLLICGRKKEALQRAQEGQFWEFALILAQQLGDQFYDDTVKQMSVHQLIAGSPLRTLCLLIAKKPEEVFSNSVMPAGNLHGASSNPVQSTGYSLVDNWEENLAVIAANRTENDHLVVLHLGDCLWKDKYNVTAAHICYLIAEADFELYSDTARLCLIGADHWSFPRTFASPEAIQRTELFEYAKALGNSQFVLLSLQPYKLIYAHMLAEVGRVSDSLKYCQAVSKALKTARSPEADTLRQLSTALEERNRAHQQSGYANLAPAKIVGKLLNFFDSTAHRVVGGLPPPAPTGLNSFQGNDHHSRMHGVTATKSQSTIAMSPIMLSASMEAINQWAVNGSKITPQNRSSSEPDIGRSPGTNQVDGFNQATLSSADSKKSGSTGTSRFGLNFGSHIFQKTVGLVLKPRQGRQAKLGNTNKFYYDEKLKRWVEEGAEAHAEEAALPPPPTTTVFQNHQLDYQSNNDLSATASSPEPASSTPPSSGMPAIPPSSGMPSIPPSSNQFSARGRMGVRSRYVDTFNKGSSAPANSFQAPSVPSGKLANLPSAKFFIPTAASSSEQTVGGESVSADDVYSSGEQNSSLLLNDPFQNLAPSPAATIQRFPSVGNIPDKGAIRSGNHSVESQSRRTASWSAIHSNTYTPPPKLEVKASPLSFMPSNQSSGSLHNSGGGFGDDLQEVEL